MPQKVAASGRRLFFFILEPFHIPSGSEPRTVNPVSTEVNPVHSFEMLAVHPVNPLKRQRYIRYIRFKCCGTSGESAKTTEVNPVHSF